MRVAISSALTVLDGYTMTISSYSRLTAQLGPVFSKKIFFICGVLKSGTTWLERLLDSHPQIACRGEAHLASDLFPLLKEALDKYNESISQKAGVATPLKEHGDHSRVPSFDANDLNAFMLTAIGLMLSNWIDDEKITCVGEKTPNNVAFLPLLSEWVPGAKFVHIIRDGRDVAVSLWNFNLLVNVGTTIGKWGTFENFARYFAQVWATQVKQGRQFAAEHGAHYYELRYEDLVNEPRKTLAGVLGFLGVTCETSQVDSCLEAASFEKLSGGRKPGQEDADSFYRKGVVGDWHQHFDEATTEAFLASAGPILADLNYL